MKNILIRAGMSPFESLSVTEILAKNAIGSNVGNLLYQYGVFRTIFKDGISITPDRYALERRNITAEEIDDINASYDCYLIPLADAFRSSFSPYLKRLTTVISKLKIPVIVIGVGVQAPYEPDLSLPMPFDGLVKKFAHEVLKRSKSIGVRGQITSDYLTNLGFQEGRDHEIIGCPSMYTFGENLNIRDPHIDEDSFASINISPATSIDIIKFMIREAENFRSYYFIPQDMKELDLSYTGCKRISPKDVCPSSASSKQYKYSHGRFPINVITWLDIMKEVDFAFGTRLHGNIAAVISGTPSLIIPLDARMRELIEYHNLTFATPGDVLSAGELARCVEHLDFRNPMGPHKTNYAKFIDFLVDNGLSNSDGPQHADRSKVTIAPETPNFDKLVREVDPIPPVKPIDECGPAEITKRRAEYEKLEALRKEAKERADLKQKIDR